MTGVAALLSILPALPAAADPAPPAASVGHAIPSDAVFYLHWRLEREGGLAARLERLRSALAGSGLLEAARTQWVETVKKQRPAGDSARDAARKRWFEEETVRWREALEAVPWWKLASREGVVALRREGEDLEALLVFHVDSAEREETIRALRQVLYAFCSASRRFEIIQSIREGESVDVLYRISVDDEGRAGERDLASLVDELLGGGRRERELCLAGKGNVVAIATSANLLGRSLQLLEGTGSDLAFTFTRAREEALVRLGAPQPPKGAGFELHARPSDLLKSVQILGGFSYLVAAGGSDGDSLAYSYRAEVPAAGGGEGAAVRKALEQADAGAMLRLLPKDSTSFRAGSGLLLKALVDVAGGAVDALTPEDASDVVKSLIRDSASRLSGPYALAASGAGPLFAVELDEEGGRLAAERLRAAGRDGANVVEESGTVFFKHKAGSNALVAIKGKLFLGGNDETVKKCLAVMEGKEPSLLDDQDRLKALGTPAADILALTEVHLGVALGVAAGASLLTPLLLRALPEDEEHALARAVVSALPNLLPVAASLRFLDRLTAHVRKDGPTAVRGEGRITFAE